MLALFVKRGFWSRSSKSAFPGRAGDTRPVKVGSGDLKELGLADKWSVEAIILKFQGEFAHGVVQAACWRSEQT